MSRWHWKIPGWRTIRRAILERDGYRCVECGRPGRLEVDHIIPLHRGGAAADPGNLRTLCRGCHRQVTATTTPTDPHWDRLLLGVHDVGKPTPTNPPE